MRRARPPRSPEVEPPIAFEPTDVGGGAGDDVTFGRPSGRRRTTIVGGLVAAIGVTVVASVVSGGSTVEQGAPTTAEPTVGTTISVRRTASFPGTPVAASAVPVHMGTTPLLGEPTGLLLYAVVAGRLTRIDLDAGSVTQLALPLDGVFTNGSGLWPSTLGPVVGDQRLYVLGPGDVLAPLSDGPATFLGEGPPGRLWFSENDTVWYRDGVDRPAIAIAIPAAAASASARPDGLGGPLVTAGGSTFRLVPGKVPEPLGPGFLVDANAGHVLEDTCDAQMRCGYVVRDLLANDVLPLTSDLIGLGRPDLRLSPDGRWALAGGAPAGGTGTGELRAHSLSGAVVTLGIAATPGCIHRLCPSAPQWSSNGAWLFAVRSGRELVAWKVGDLAAAVLRLPDATVEGFELSFTGPIAPVARPGS